ncbi:MAG: sensor histidine kinase [Clostridia bacterium]|nr:sensor histidine kinase [Clostridia bacterium]
MEKELRSSIYSGIIGIGISLMFMLSIEGFPQTVAPFIAYTILGLVAGLFISFSYITTKRLFSRFRAYNEHLFLRIIHSYLVCTLAFFLVALVMTLLPWSVFPSLKTAFYSSMGVGIISAMICFYFEYLAIKDERLRLEERNKELAVVEERNRIARELHDSVSQSLFGISLNLNTLELILQSQPEEAKALIGQVKEMVEEAQREMRLMIYGLQPTVLREKGFFEALETLCELFGARYQLEVTSLLEGDETRIDHKTQLALYRVIQEALHNIVKHARATKAKVSLTIQEREAVARIEDNGQGFNGRQAKSSGLGLAGMKERIAALQGDFHLAPAPGKGTTITVRIPLFPPPGSSSSSFRP